MAKLDLDVLTIKTGTTADIKMSDKVLQKGELLADTNSSEPQLYVGDGTTQVKNLKGIGGYTLPKLYWANQEVSLSKSTQKLPSFGGINIVDEYDNKLALLTKDYLYIGALGQSTNYIKNAYIKNLYTGDISVNGSNSITLGGTKIKSGKIDTPTLNVTQDTTFGTLGDSYTCTINGILDLNNCTVKGLKVTASIDGGFKSDTNSVFSSNSGSSSAWFVMNSSDGGTVQDAFMDWHVGYADKGWLFRVGNNRTGFGVRAVGWADQAHLLYNYETVASKIRANDIYGNVQTSSDRQLKKDISNLDRKYDTLFNNLQPVSFKYKDGHRTHVGFIAQDIKEAMNKANMSNEDFAAYCEDKKDNGVECSLRYSEFIAINTMQIKKLKDEVKELKEQINKLTKTRKKKEVTE